MTRGMKWYILNTLDTKNAEQHFLMENIRRMEQGLYAYQYFIPYEYLKQQSVAKERQTDTANGKKPLPQDVSAAKRNNAIRTTLRRYVFVKAGERDLAEFLNSDWNRYSAHRLNFYYNKSHQHVTITPRSMEQFINACADYRLQFDVVAPISEIAANEEVILKTTAFKGEKARVLEVVHAKGGTHLTLGLNLFSGTMLLRLHNVSEADITRLSGQSFTAEPSHLINKIQDSLLEILSRRVYRKTTAETMADDNERLDEIYNYRYHTIDNDAARRHFLALMLIGAYLRNDNDGKQRMILQAQDELEQINSRSESKAATDVRAYLHVALYIATRNPDYRDKAKAYVQEHNPKSEPLKQFVRLIRKRQKI